MSVLIDAQNLGRYYGEIKAVDGVSFQVKRGEVLGFLGPNGAGKSTTMKLLTCFLTPTFGTAIVGGFDILTQSVDVRRSIGYLPENAPLYGDMSVVEFLRFISEVREMPVAKRESAVEWVLGLTALRDVVNQRIETLSKGYKRRVGLAQALIHDPEILILDEPTDGLDPNQKHEVRQLINSMAQQKCIILSTHILEEVDEVCDRVVIIAHGKKVIDDTPAELLKRSSVHGAVSLVVASDRAEEVYPKLKGLAGVLDVRREIIGDEVTYTLIGKDSKAVLFALSRAAESERWPIDAVRIEAGYLDEVFRNLTV